MQELRPGLWRWTARHPDSEPDPEPESPIANADETMYWLSAPRALVPGDRLLGNGAGGVRTCPDSWLGYIRREGGEIDEPSLREALRPLLDLPIELLLVSHGEPILSDGRGALARALEV